MNKITCLAVRKIVQSRIAAGMAGMLCLCALCFVGCDSKEEVYLNRTDDPQYQRQQTEMMDAQKKINKLRAGNEAKMARMVAKKLETMPVGTSKQAVIEEFDKNIDQYPEWKALRANEDEIAKAYERHRQQAMMMIRERMVKEAGDRKAVSEGRARPKQVK